MGTPERFDQRLPPELEGFGPAFYRDLRDLAASYGSDVRGIEGLRRIDLPTPLPCQVTVTVPPSKMGNLNLRPFPFDGNVSRFITLVLDDEVNSYVQWDMRVTAAQVKEAMAAIDAEMAHCRDPLTGRRRRVASDTYAPPHLQVDRVFGEQGAVMLLPKDVDPEVMRLQFDRPADLMVLPDADGKGHRGLCRKSDVVLRSRYDEVVERVLARYGVHGQAQIDGMSRERLQAMLEEVERELEKE
ncbi:MAG TPA: hypothetical protein VL426_01920 [Candidatus Binatia bacterium]|nr:hypothetical protein [Candidatus Binatia bacterium]